MRLPAKKLKFKGAVKLTTELTQLDLRSIDLCIMYCSSVQALKIDGLLSELQMYEMKYQHHLNSPSFTHMNLDTFALWLQRIGYDEPENSRVWYWLHDLFEYLIIAHPITVNNREITGHVEI